MVQNGYNSNCHCYMATAKNSLPMKPIFLDCESAGLRGEIFAAALIGFDGEVIFDGFFRHEALQTNSWLHDNVEPNLTGVEYSSMLEFRMSFVDAYESCREEYGYGEYSSLAVVAHCGAPVEANFFQQLYGADLLAEFSGPFPLLDTAPLLLQAGYDPISEEAFAQAKGIKLPDGYKAHSALADAQLTRLVWIKSMQIK